MIRSFRSRLLEGETLIGTMFSLASREAAEILAEAGFDWLFIDAEHAPFTVADIQATLQVINGRCYGLVRLASSDEVSIKKALDAGAAGIIAPHVNSEEQARQVVRWSKYPPQGERSAGIARAHGYGLRLAEYIASANEETAVIVQVEHVDAVSRIKAILGVKGVDGVLIGPYDLSGSMGKLGQVADPEVLAAIESVRMACQAAGKPAGIYGISAEAVRPYMAQGFSLILVGIDSLFLANAAQASLASLGR